MVSLVNRLLSYFLSKFELLITNRFLPIAESIIFIDSRDYSLIFIINFLLPFFSSISSEEIAINITIVFSRISFKRDTINIATIFSIKRPFFGADVFNIIIRKASVLAFYLT